MVKKTQVAKTNKQNKNQVKKQRDANKNPDVRKKLNKDPGLPKLGAYKSKLGKLQQKSVKKAPKNDPNDMEIKLTPEQQLLSLQKNVELQNEKYEEKESLLEQTFNLKDASRRAFFKQFKKVVKSADVILEILDARDPLGCRSPQIERQILSKDPNKKIILILNKIDLIPKQNMLAWLSYFRKEFPTLAFKCSTQQQRTHLSRMAGNVEGASDSMLTTNQCLGADNLIMLLKNYCRTSNVKKTISVGVIGFPNVGKSSIINSLKREKAVGVGAQPGFTKTTTEVVLDSNITLIDCPGIIFSSDISEEEAALRNCVKFEQIDNYLLPIESIIKKCSVSTLSQIYKIPQFNSAPQFLREVAIRMGRMKKGGIPDEEAGAKIIIQDWSIGKIPYYTLPPKEDKPMNAQIVNQWSDAFNMNALIEMEKDNVYGFVSDSVDLHSFEVRTEYDEMLLDDKKKKPEVITVIGEIKEKRDPYQNKKPLKLVELEGVQRNADIQKLVKNEKKREKKMIDELLKEHESETKNNTFGASFWTSNNQKTETDQEMETVNAFNF